MEGSIPGSTMEDSLEKKGYDLCKDLENWMSNLPQELRNISIIHLAIPGTHDSMTYNISYKSKVSPDAEEIFQKLKCLGPILSAVMAKWAITQSFNTLKQLQNGIRYFDLRLSTKPNTEDLFFVHSLYGDDVKGPFNEIKMFLETHPREVIILDCQHFYAFGPSDHERFMRIITTTFGHKLVPYMQHMDHLTLDYLTKQFRYQVICIYRSDQARFGQPLFWPSDSFPNPWPNTDVIPKLINTLEENIKNKDGNKGYVSQCILTPSARFVIKHCCGSLRSQCACPLEKPVKTWLMQQSPGENGINIVISDFIDMSCSDFCTTVINLNEKLLKNIPVE